MEWVSAAPGHFQEDTHPNYCVCAQFSQAGAWHPSYLTTCFFLSPELFCLTLGKEEGKLIQFFLSKPPHNSDNRQSQNFTFNICCQTTLMLRHLQPDITGTILGIPVRSQCSWCCADRELNLCSKVFLVLWSTQGVQRWISHSPSQPPDPNTDGAYTKSTDTDETFQTYATIIGVSHKTEMKVQQSGTLFTRYTSKCILNSLLPALPTSTGRCTGRFKLLEGSSGGM